MVGAVRIVLYRQHPRLTALYDCGTPNSEHNWMGLIDRTDRLRWSEYGHSRGAFYFDRRTADGAVGPRAHPTGLDADGTVFAIGGAVGAVLFLHGNQAISPVSGNGI